MGVRQRLESCPRLFGKRVLAAIAGAVQPPDLFGDLPAASASSMASTGVAPMPALRRTTGSSFACNVSRHAGRSPR